MPTEDGTPTQAELDAKASADAEAAKAAAPPESVSREEFDKLVQYSQGLATSLQKAGERIAIIDKVAEMLTGKTEETLTPQERAVVAELQRLMPHILPNAKFLDEVPGVKKVVDQAAQATAETLVNSAFAVQLDLQKASGLPIDNPKANRLIAGAIRDYINEDKTRQARFWRGDRDVITEAFEDSKPLFVDSVRAVGKRETAEALKHRPKNAAPVAGGAPGGSEATLDYRDPKAVRAAMKAALA